MCNLKCLWLTVYSIFFLCHHQHNTHTFPRAIFFVCCFRYNWKLAAPRSRLYIIIFLITRTRKKSKRESRKKSLLVYGCERCFKFRIARVFVYNLFIWFEHFCKQHFTRRIWKLLGFCHSSWSEQYVNKCSTLSHVLSNFLSEWGS